MTLKIFITPQFNAPDTGEGGIRRVIEAQIKHLPKFGVEVTGRLDEADLTIGHAGNIVRRNGKPYIACCHGMMWKDYFVEKWAHEVNGGVVSSLVQADAITVPSQWVRQALTRGLMRRPKVIYHGVDFGDWHHKKKNAGYILWNKGRADKVSEPDDMQRVASMMVDRQFVSTFGTDTDNVSIIGRIPAPKMKDYVQRAGVYLALPRETFGIGILEALASGVPVAGWRYGGQQEIIIEGETGYLADPGNYDQLRDCIYKCIAERDRLSKNCMEDARTRWAWEDKIESYAELFKSVTKGVHGQEHSRGLVSVIVTCHNLGRYLSDALRSLIDQTYTNWECIIVDDQSADNTAEIAQGFSAKDKRFRYFRTPHNLKLSGALNYGFEQSRGKYVVNLDADNMMPADALRIQAEALDADPSVHIVSGDLDLVSDDGTQKREKIWHNKTDFDFRAQFAHINNIHSSSMMRRSVREELGGYRERYWRAEDAHFWCMAASYGFWIKMCTSESTLIYRMRSDSKSMQERHENPDADGDWTIDFPWRIAGNPADGARLLRDSKGIPNSGIVPIGAQLAPTVNHGFCWNVFHRQNPLVSVIIPVGPGHKRYVIDALDSLMAQDFHDWEAVVINDTGDEWDEIPGAPYANVFQNDTGRRGPATSRNVGHTKARGKLLLYLDSDDYLMPGSTLRKMVERYAKGDAGYIYTDNVMLSADIKSGRLDRRAAFDQSEWRAQSSVTILIAKADIMRFGGFDEYIRDWEEWEMFLRMQVAGVCGVYLPIVGFFYRFHTGTQRDKSAQFGKQEIYPFLKQRYQDYFDGVKQMAQCCGGNGDAVLEAKAAIERAYQINEGMAGVSRIEHQERVQQQSGITPQWVRMEFINQDRRGSVTYFGHDQRQYRGGYNDHDRYADVHPSDVQKLEVTGHWRVIHVKAEKVEEIVIDPGEIEIPEIAIPVQMTESLDPVPEAVQPVIEPVAFFDPVKTGLMVDKKKTTKKVRRSKNGKRKNSSR